MNRPVKLTPVEIGSRLYRKVERMQLIADSTLFQATLLFRFISRKVVADPASIQKSGRIGVFGRGRAYQKFSKAIPYDK
jgi:hypothetical protein